MNAKILFASAMVSSLVLPSAFGQGALTPPGPPAPTMKSLAQIEPRTPVDATHTPTSGDVQFFITQPGSYYLTTNIVGASGLHGIGIDANNVTLDLNGFSVLGASNTGYGIYIYAVTNTTVRNGAISGWSIDGVHCSAYNATLERLAISANGQYGIYFAGIGAVIRDCIVSSNAFVGVSCVDTGVIKDCTVADNAQQGILIAKNCIVSSCLVKSNQYDGVYVANGGNVIIGNVFAGNDTAGSVNNGGININASNNRIEGNHVTGTGAGGFGISVNNSLGYTNNIIIRNSVENSGANNYSIPTPRNDVGPIGSASTNTSPWGNISH
jgi:parallel beta-helix repeat protein